jgi:hypothetical protein
MKSHVYLGGHEIVKAANVDLHLHVVGVQSHPSGQRVYRLATRDGHYVGRANPTKVRAVKGDVVKVQAAHVKTTESGDVVWTNANVASLRRDVRGDSWRDMVSRIGGGDITPDMALIDKDGVPPAGDAPDVDAEETTRVPTGPTARASHVDRPLKNLSVFYGKKKKTMKVVKAMEHQQLIYGIVLEPDVIDSQADFVPAREVEKAAHLYLKKALRGKASVSKLQHRVSAFSRFNTTKGSVVPVESFIAPVDFTYPGSQEQVTAGSWVICMHVEDPELWQDVLDGHYQGFSIGGKGSRERVGGLYTPS